MDALTRVLVHLGGADLGDGGYHSSMFNVLFFPEFLVRALMIQLSSWQAVVSPEI